MPLLEVQHLQKIYTTRFGVTQVTALADVNFSVEPGEYVAIMGESGSGKTTLLNILAALDRPTAGEVFLNGKALSDIRERDLAAFRRSHLGFVFQDFNLLDTFSVQDNILLPLVLAGRKYPEMVKRLKPLAARLGIEALLKKYPYEISGGQKQRVAVARALATDPKVLLCDEATSALDPTTTASILGLLKDLNAKLGVTVVVITHQMSVIEAICSRVAILDGGRVAELGTVQDIFSHPATDAARRLVYPGGVSISQYPASTRAIRVSFNGGTAYQPLIASVAIDCGVKLNILGADTRNVGGKALGTMLLGLPEDSNEAAKALSYIRSQPYITVEEVEYRG